MSDKTLIEWNADVGTRFLTIHPDGSFNIDKDAPPLFVIGELAKAFIRQQDRIKRLEEAYEGEIGEQPELLGSNVMGLLKRELNFAQKRIKRLEEAGDEIIWAFCPASVSMMTERESDALKLWNEAKEAKP